MTGDLVYFSRKLRNNLTQAEEKLWRYLKSKQFLGLKFRRQQPIGSYIVDFVCFENRIVIELDGGQLNDNPDKDNERDNWLRSQGFVVLRFWNNEVMKNMKGLMAVLRDCCESHPPPAPPVKGGGKNRRFHRRRTLGNGLPNGCQK
ncbi:MAG: endonuclease domain-containing protein [Spirochaetes bacterium]|nr:endonuclease domain-containing protein [Spirochaetota bacterium]